MMWKLRLGERMGEGGSLQVGIITASDKGVAGEREDASGRVIKEMIGKIGGVVADYRVVPDDQEVLERVMREMVAADLELVLTTGGTGFSPRDVTPEATLAVVERLVPGIPEAMRAFSLQKTKRAMLSRAVAGIARRTLIINLPGSPRAVAECLEAVLDQLPHGIAILRGQAGECGQSLELQNDQPQNDTVDN